MKNYFMVVWEDWVAAESVSGLQDLRLASEQREQVSNSSICASECVQLFSLEKQYNW